MNLCPKCGNETQEDTAFCTGCGCAVKSIKCPRCRKKIEEGMAFCAACGCAANHTEVAKPANSGGCAGTIGLLLFIVGIVLMVSVLMSLGSGTSTSGSWITLSQYNQISSGMTRREVTDILGSGTQISTIEMFGVTTSIYSWKGQGSSRANATITFQNGGVVSKAQVGLR